MLLQLNGTVMTIIFIIIAAVLLWLFLYLASSWIVSKTYASDKKLILLLSAFILVIIVPFIAGLVGMLLGLIGGLLAGLRDLIDGGGRDYVSSLTIIVAFLLFLAILKWLCGMEWEKALWISLLGLFLLYCLYSIFPELVMFGSAL